MADLPVVTWDFGEHQYLKGLILSGKKTATTGLLKPSTVVPKAGDVVRVQDAAGNVFAMIRYTSVEVKPFLEVDYEYAKLEGEGDKDIEEWRQKHREFFSKYYPDLFSDRSLVVCSQFQLVKIQSVIKSDNREYRVEYCDADSFEHIEGKVTQAYGVCFYGGKMVIVLNGQKGTWGLVGGTVEPGETYEDTLRREIQEESNMRLINFLPVGYQKVTDPKSGESVIQLRYVCEVEPFGQFKADPDGKISEIKLVDPSEYKSYFDWGEIGERIVSRAVELKSEISGNLIQ